MTVEEIIARTCRVDFEVNAREMQQRSILGELRRLDRLEAALATARARVHWPVATTAFGHR